MVTDEFPDISVLFPSVSINYSSCDRKKCLKLKEKGNNFYVKKKLGDALKFYTNAIDCAPIDDDGTGDEISKLLANRSAVYFEMEQFFNCLHDIESAFQFGYSYDNRFKLYERRAKVFIKLNCFKEAKIEFGKAMENLKKQNKNTDKIEKQLLLITNPTLRKTLDFDPYFKSSSKSTRSKLEEKILKSFQSHKNYPSLCSKVDIEYTEESGRFVVANENIQAGEIIAKESAFLSTLNPDRRQSQCHHCFQSIQTLHGTSLPSPYQPSRVKFCSLSCLRKRGQISSNRKSFGCHGHVLGRRIRFPGSILQHHLDIQSHNQSTLRILYRKPKFIPRLRQHPRIQSQR